MISNSNFVKEKIYDKAKKNDVSNEHLEKLACALKLLETLVENDIPFVFKGGTSLLLLIDRLSRLSIDIDILCAKKDKKYVISKLSNIESNFFHDISEQARPNKPGIDKAHFIFPYDSVIDEEVEESYVLLDLVFDDNVYSKTLEKEIMCPLLEFEGTNYHVQLPTVNELIGDKLVAFAPHTCGIKFTDYYKGERPKHIEIIKQMFDISNLIDYMDNFDEVAATYNNIATHQIAYIDGVANVDECLKDTIKTCSNIISYGDFGPKDDYNLLLQGLNGFNAYVLGNKITNEHLVKIAVKIYNLASKILHKNKIGNIEIPDSTSFFGKRKGQIQLALQDRDLYSEFKRCAYKNALKDSKFGTF